MKTSKVAGRTAVYVPEHPKANNRGYILEYRYIVEQAIGRFLTDEEQIHHINGDSSDNRLENLQIVSASEHSKIHSNLTSLPPRRTLPYDKIQELMQQGLGYRRIAKTLGIKESSTKYACNAIRGSI
jgi:hypothetical protein